MKEIRAIIQELRPAHHGPAFDVKTPTILIVTPVILAILYYYGLASYYRQNLLGIGLDWFGDDWPYLGMLPYIYMCGMLTLMRLVVPVLIILFFLLVVAKVVRF